MLMSTYLTVMDILQTVACDYVRMSVSIYLLCEVSDLNVNIADSDGDTALHLAVWFSKVSYAQLNKACGNTNVKYIRYRGNVSEVLRLMNARGHKVNVQDNTSGTPLHYACLNDNSKNIVETLMLAGADETIINDKGETPAQVAENRGHSELLKLLDKESLRQVMLGRRNKLK